MKTKEELSALTKEVEALSKKLRELSEEELEFISGGLKIVPKADDEEESWLLEIVNWLNKIVN